MPPPPVRTFSYHCRQRYGQTVGKIPIDLGLVCPNRLEGGCIFCRSASFTPSCLKSGDPLSVQLTSAKRQLLQGRFRTYLAYFQQETCTALPPGEMLPLCEQLLEEPDCLGLILSTRPDYLDTELLEPLALLVEKSGKDCLFELGLQSSHDRSLQLLNRNHSYSDFVRGARLVKEAGCFELGAHLIFGIPGESEEEMLATVEAVCALGLDALKLHHLQVIRETVLETMYNKGEVRLFSLEDYLELLLKVIPLVPQNITIHRLWATAHPKLLVAPKWNVLASTLSGMLREKMAAVGVRQGQLAPQGSG